MGTAQSVRGVTRESLADYDSGSITTTDDGEIIYSDDSGNSFSTGFWARWTR